MYKNHVFQNSSYFNVKNDQTASKTWHKKHNFISKNRSRFGGPSTSMTIRQVVSTDNEFFGILNFILLCCLLLLIIIHILLNWIQLIRLFALHPMTQKIYFVLKNCSTATSLRNQFYSILWCVVLSISIYFSYVAFLVYL